MTTRAEDILHGVGQFLHREARLLDERRWDDWLALWEPDGRYVVPTRFVPLPSQGAPARPTDAEFSDPDGLSFVDDDRTTLMLRVMKLRTGKAWSEDPPSRTTRLVTNIEAERHGDGRVRVRSNFLLYCTRHETDVVVYAGSRADVLRECESSYTIVHREVRLNTGVLTAPALSLFF